MIREAPAMTVRQNLGELLNEVQYRHGKVLITKAGKPVTDRAIICCAYTCYTCVDFYLSLVANFPRFLSWRAAGLFGTDEVKIVDSVTSHVHCLQINCSEFCSCAFVNCIHCLLQRIGTTTR